MHGFAPVIHPSSFGAEREDTQGYGGGFEDGDEGGQIRGSVHMEDPWAMHELRYTESPLTGHFDFVPATVKNNPTVTLFDPRYGVSDAAAAARNVAVGASLPTLFLPHRARVLQTYLQVCDLDAMFGNFQRGVPESGGFKQVAPGRTLGGGRTH